MEPKDILYYQAKLLAAYAEIEGMKADNKMREMNNNSIAYGEDSFLLIKKELETIIRDMGGF
jgi:hypothetical protein